MTFVMDGILQKYRKAAINIFDQKIIAVMFYFFTLSVAVGGIMSGGLTGPD
jgi:hypothetical protein